MILILPHFIHRDESCEAKSGTQSLQHYTIDEACPDPYGTYLEFCRMNLNLLRKAEKIGNNIYIQVGVRTNVYAGACNYVTDIVRRHNDKHPNIRIQGKVGGVIHFAGDEFEPDFGIQPRGFPPHLGPTVVGGVQYSTHDRPGNNSAVISCDQRAASYLRMSPHISAFLCVDIEYEWPQNGYPKIILYYFSLPDEHPESVLVQPKRVVNIGRILTTTEYNAIITKYPTLVHNDVVNIFGNGMNGCKDCHPNADTTHYVFEIPGSTVLYTNTDHTEGVDHILMNDITVGIQIDCRILLNGILSGALMDGEKVNFGPHWPWDVDN